MIILAYDGINDTEEKLCHILKRMYGEDSVQFFTDRDELLKYGENHIFHVIFFRPGPAMDKDVDTAERMLHLIPGVNLILVCEDESLALRALKIHASGYITLPFTEEKAREEMENLLYPVYESLPEIRIERGKNIKVFINGDPVYFNYEKTGELFALLMDSGGGMLSTGELIDNLWHEDKDISKSRSYLQNIRSDLFHTLSLYGLKEAIGHRRGRMWIDMEKIRV